VRPAEKLGVVGKTGSGKSTLVSLLLRLGPLKGVAPSSGGRLLLDGIDVATLKLSLLRSKVAVVPQDPTILKMSLKENVGEEFTDAEVLMALERCCLSPQALTGIESLSDALAAPLNAKALSIGQQQLLMAARALVRKPKVLILDECTASMDRESADQLLEVVTKHTKDSTVLAIAHRLRFVINSDRILVLGHGNLICLDTPANLMKDTDSYFATNVSLEQQEDGVVYEELGELQPLTNGTNGVHHEEATTNGVSNGVAPASSTGLRHRGKAAEQGEEQRADPEALLAYSRFEFPV